MKFLRFLVFLIPALSLVAETNTNRVNNKEEKTKEINNAEKYKPLFTGPLLAPSATTTDPGHFLLQPYYFQNKNVGLINNHWHLHRFSEPTGNVNLQMLTYFGLGKFIEYTMMQQFFMNFQGNVDNWRFGDMSMGLGFQLLAEKSGKWFPNIKVSFNETFPTGVFENLSSKQLGTDASGGGSFVSSFGLIFSKLFHIYKYCFLRGRTAFVCDVFSPVTVHGFNAYGGDTTTNGRFTQGPVLKNYVGLECTMSKHWALALDILNTYTIGTNFTGTTIASVGSGSYSYTLSFAPAIEYNYNENFGLIGGVWFSAVGRNSFSFVNGVLSAVIAW